MHEVIVVPFLDRHLVVSPGRAGGLGLPQSTYLELAAAPDGSKCPDWFADAVARTWGLDLAGRPLAPTVLVRPASLLGFGRASYELNLGCNYACKHCYLGLKEFAGLAWPERERLLHAIREAGVVWLQLTGGEPMIDRHFADVYALGHELGMMIEILTNGSRLAHPRILGLLTSRRPHRITLSLYGATEASYDGLTQRRGAWASFLKGLEAHTKLAFPSI